MEDTLKNVTTSGGNQMINPHVLDNSLSKDSDPSNVTSVG